jgi:hypothetical protein
MGEILGSLLAFVSGASVVVSAWDMVMAGAADI